MRIFLTGATGVVGSRVLPQLLAQGHSVLAAVRSAEGKQRVEGAGATATAVDLFSAEAVRRAVSGCEVVVNLATHVPAPSARMLLPWAWRENDRIRSVGARNVAEAALSAGAARLVQESFALIHEDGADRWIDESSPVRPVRYNLTTLDAEAAVARFAAGGGAGVVLRFAAFYGPDAVQSLDLARAVRRGFAPLPGRPDGYLSSLAHDDAATAVVAALTVPGGIYEVADDVPLTRRDLADAVAAALSVPRPRLPPPWLGRLAGSAGELLSRSLRISNRKLEASSGWTPRYPSAREGWRALAGVIAGHAPRAGGRTVRPGHA